MTLYPDELQNTDGTITQLTNEELRSLLKEKDQELETLKSSHAAPEDSWKSTYELISSLEKYKTEEVLVKSLTEIKATRQAFRNATGK